MADNLTVNMTQWENVSGTVQMIQNANASTEGFLGIGFLFILWCVVFFAASRRAPFSHAVGVAFFSTMVGSLFLQRLDLIGWEATATSAVILVIMIVVAYLEKQQ